MNTIYDCVLSFQALLNKEYHFVVGRKMTKISFDICFDKADCYHLMGLQHLKDIDGLKGKRQKVFDKIMDRKIQQEKIEQSHFYPEIAERIHFLPMLETLLDSNDTIFKYHKKFNKFSKIEAEVLLCNKMFDQDLYLFLDQRQDGKYFCRSFFPRRGLDYTKNQPRYTLLYKEKRYLEADKIDILYDKLTPKS